MADVDDRGIGLADEWVERQGTLAHDHALDELRPADQAEVQRQRKPEGSDREQRERGARGNLNRSMPAQPPYLVT
jgi:hypothetical protein